MCFPTLHFCSIACGQEWWFLWLILKRSGETDGLRTKLDNCRKRKRLKLTLLRRGFTIVTRHAKDKHFLCGTVWNPTHTLHVHTNHHRHTLIDKENPDWPHNWRSRSNSLYPARHLTFCPPIILTKCVTLTLWKKWGVCVWLKREKEKGGDPKMTKQNRVNWVWKRGKRRKKKKGTGRWNGWPGSLCLVSGLVTKWADMGAWIQECCSNNIVVNPVKYAVCQMPSGSHCAVIFLWRPSWW